MPDGELLTDRLRLRPWTTRRDDLARLTDIYCREEVTRWLGGTPSVGPVELVCRWAQIRRADPLHGTWAIEVRDESPAGSAPVVAGTVLLKPLPGGVGEVEVGWHLHPDCWGRGYATEAARAVVAHAFGAGLPEVYAVVRPGNEASLAVCRRLGMASLGRLRRWYDVELEVFRLMAPVVVE
ncbi:GNAT family N-acetyltransferase [Geodermatophilus aquaeductus]|uniref:Protein N-acetyltransferase, RimJ/RimL family n=1 Tax=Geodermatophilus aquaeductus TaxID=1564161 RepID=A0A521E4W2_9ACTN|nr:GNAT family N-acetyltransferase [Geodermatophilus aquaeductus]SMO78401.1 Protein N-acetyltransferase, RimJ/RimL family [Geodermatophilus aquaeductus]